MICFIFIGLFTAAFLARFNFFRIPKKGVSVLLYHRISAQPSGTAVDKFSVSPETFEKQIKYLKRKNFISILPSEMEKIDKEKLWKKNKYVLITFDDGYKDNLKAAEILKKYSFKGLFFISTAYTGKTMNSIEMLNTDDIKRIISYGMAIGSHSHNHIKLAQLNNSEIKKEILTSLKNLSQFGKIEDFAYPFGNYNGTVIDILKKHKFKRAYIIGQKIYQPDKFSKYEIPRAIVRKNTTIIDFYLMITRGRSRF